MSEKNELSIELDGLKNEVISNVSPLDPLETSLSTTDVNINNNDGQALSIKSKLKEYLLRLKIFLINNLMFVLIVIAASLGLGLGFALRATNMDSQIKNYIGLPGELFVRALKFIAMPLIFCNLITGMSGLKTRSNKIKRIGLQTFLFYAVSLILSLLVGYLFVLTIKPGNRTTKGLNITIYDPLPPTKISTHDTIIDIFRNLIPDNIVAMSFQTYKSILTPITVNNTVTIFKTIVNESNVTITVPVNTSSIDIGRYSVSAGSSFGTNYLGMLLFCLIFGSVISKMGEKGRDLHNFFDNLSKSFLELISLAIWLSPIGVFSLLLSTILKLEQPEEVFQLLSLYMTTCIVGFILHAVIILPLMHFIVTRKKIFGLLKNVSEALVVAFATASSLVTLPVTLRCIEQKHKIPKLISRPILFIGTSVHFSGLPLYQLIGAVFIGQINNVPIDTAQYFLVGFLTLISSMTVAGIPSGGLVTIVLSLNVLNINQSQIGLIFTVDWFIDRLLTVVNVWGNCIATDVIYDLQKKNIEDLEKEE